MKDLRIVGWTDFESEYPTRKFNNEELKTYINLIQDEIEKNNYMFSGEEHQNCKTGVPVFSDGTCFRASMRCWGSIMASVFKGPNGEQLSYMDFYMSLEDSNMPEYKEIDVEPAVLEEDFIGCTTREDLLMLAQSEALGMLFMTTDKVLQKLSESQKK